MLEVYKLVELMGVRLRNVILEWKTLGDFLSYKHAFSISILSFIYFVTS